MQKEYLDVDVISPAVEHIVREHIRKNYQDFKEAGTVIIASERRLPNLVDIYSQPGRRYFVAYHQDNENNHLVAGCGIGSLQGLPPSEGIAEIRDLFVDKKYRGLGIGGLLVRTCLNFAKEFGYKQIYLQMTPQMEPAQRLFKKFGFTPVEDKNTTEKQSGGSEKLLPCYFILPNLQQSS